MESSDIIAERNYILKDKIKNYGIACDVKATSLDTPIDVGTGRQAAALFSILSGMKPEQYIAWESFQVLTCPAYLFLLHAPGLASRRRV